MRSSVRLQEQPVDALRHRELRSIDRAQLTELIARAHRCLRLGVGTQAREWIVVATTPSAPSAAAQVFVDEALESGGVGVARVVAEAEGVAADVRAARGAAREQCQRRGER